MDCGWNLFTKEGMLHLRLDLFPLSFCSRSVFSFRIRMIAKENISSWEHLPSVAHLNFTFFQNNHMKTFSVAFTRLKCSEILSILYKKKWWTIFLKAFFCLSYDLSKRNKNKTSANVNILWRDGQSFVTQTNNHFIQVWRIYWKRETMLCQKNYSSFNFVSNHFLCFFFRLLVTACNEKHFCLESACQVSIT